MLISGSRPTRDASEGFVEFARIRTAQSEFRSFCHCDFLLLGQQLGLCVLAGMCGTPQMDSLLAAAAAQNRAMLV